MLGLHALLNQGKIHREKQGERESVVTFKIGSRGRNMGEFESWGNTGLVYCPLVASAFPANGELQTRVLRFEQSYAYGWKFPHQ